MKLAVDLGPRGLPGVVLGLEVLVAFAPAEPEHLSRGCRDFEKTGFVCIVGSYSSGFHVHLAVVSQTTALRCRSHSKNDAPHYVTYMRERF